MLKKVIDMKLSRIFIAAFLAAIMLLSLVACADKEVSKYPPGYEAYTSVLAMPKEEAYEKFGYLLDAFKYGVPPHGGLAFGFDRLVTLLLGLEDIRDVIAFPKVQNASELLSKCPAAADPKALAELGIAVVAAADEE